MSDNARFTSRIAAQRERIRPQDLMGFYTIAMICALFVLAVLDWKGQDLRPLYLGIASFAMSLVALVVARNHALRQIEEPAHAFFVLSPFVTSLLWVGLLGFAVSSDPQQGNLNVFNFSTILLSIVLLASASLAPISTLLVCVPAILFSSVQLAQADASLMNSVSIIVASICAVWFSFRNWEAKLNEESLNSVTDKLSVKNRFIDALKTDLHAAQVRADKAESLLKEQERNFETRLLDQTRELSDTNTQLSQQIGLKQKISDALLKSQTRLNQAIEASNLGMFDWEIEQGQFYQSALLQYFGPKEQSSEEVIYTLKEIIHPEDYPHARDTLNLCLAGKQERYQVRYRVKAADEWVWIEECGKVTEFSPSGVAARMLGTRRNITEEVSRNEQIRLAKSVFDFTSEGVFVLDKSCRFLSINPAYTEITGYDEAHVVGKSILSVSHTPQKEDLYTQIFADLNANGYWSGEILEQKTNGEFYPQWTQINTIYNESKDIQYYAGLISDLTNRKQVDEKLDYLLNYDDTTKLANRYQFKDQLHRALLRYKDEGIAFALLIFDIDRFNRFNDSFGHDLSDELLLAFANRLNEFSGEVDIMARLGGNEFACVVPVTDVEQLKSFAEHILFQLTRKHYELAGQEVVLSCSVGVAIVPDHVNDIENLVQYASLAVQKAKYGGGQHVQYFNDSLKQFTRDKLELEQELRKAINNKELQVYYQPKLDLRTGEISSYEALVRWSHPKRGDISPEEFVHIAEECGLIFDLGAYVLRVACNQTQQWVRQGLGDLHVSVNLSPRQIKESGIKQIIGEAIDNTGILPERLEMELTESAIMEDMSGAVEVLNGLREMGIKVSVDDFGTGYSSLNYLQKLPVDTLKIDRAFIMGLEDSREQQAIAKAIMVLGSTLNLQVVAEGVENEAQLAFLHEHNCDLVQGYLISKPVEAHDMQRILEKQKHKVA